MNELSRIMLVSHILFCLIHDATAKPSAYGRSVSSTTISGVFCRIISHAFVPFDVQPTSSSSLLACISRFVCFSRDSSAHASKILHFTLFDLHLLLSPGFLYLMPIDGLHLIFTYSARPRKRISLLFPAYLPTIFDKTAFFLSNVRFYLCRAGISRFLVKPHNLSIKTAFCAFTLA